MGGGSALPCAPLRRMTGAMMRPETRGAARSQLPPVAEPPGGPTLEGMSMTAASVAERYRYQAVGGDAGAGLAAAMAGSGCGAGAIL